MLGGAGAGAVVVRGKQTRQWSSRAAAATSCGTGKEGVGAGRRPPGHADAPPSWQGEREARGREMDRRPEEKETEREEGSKRERERERERER